MAYVPKFEITSDLLNLLNRATELRAWIHSTTIKVPWTPVLKSDTELRLAHSSTAIEGNPLSLEQVKLLVRGADVYATPNTRGEIIGYLEALKWIRKQPNRATLTENKILQMHKFITYRTKKKKTAGKYKTKPNRIVDGKKITVYNPPDHRISPKLLRELIEWINETRKSNLHPLLVSAIAHHRFVSIHPFSDGNGRTARVLAIWILYTRDFDTHHLFTLDEYYYADLQKYYDKLQQVRGLDEVLTYWLEYAAEALVDTLEKTRERVLTLGVQQTGQEIRLNSRQEQVLRLVLERGIVRAPEIMEIFELTRSRVNQIVKPLVEAGLLLQEGQTRATSYRLPQ